MPNLNFKRQARLDMHEVRPRVLWTTLVYFAIYLVLSLLAANLSGYSAFAQNYADLFQRIEFLNPKTMEEMMEIIASASDKLIPEVAPFSQLLSVVLSLMIVMLSAGFTGYCLKVSRRQESNVRDLMCSFEHFFKILWLQILRGIFVFLWSLLLIIPGIVAAIRYSQSLLILYDHPEYRVIDCIRESKRMMKGQCTLYFALLLSFCLWAFLDYLVTMYARVALLKIYLFPFFGLTMTHFYNYISGYAQAHPRPETDDTDNTPFM